MDEYTGTQEDEEEEEEEEMDIPDFCKVLLLTIRWRLFRVVVVSFAIVPEVSITLVMH